MIHASLYARLVADPIERTTKTGKQMATCRVAVDAAGHGAETEETLWVDLLAFGSQAEALLELQRGQMVSAIGRLTKGRYTAKDGTERETFTLVADSLISARTPRPKTKAPTRSEAPRASRELDFDDALPF